MKQLNTRNIYNIISTPNYQKHSSVPCAVSLLKTNKKNLNISYNIMKHDNASNKNLTKQKTSNYYMASVSCRLHCFIKYNITKKYCNAMNNSSTSTKSFADSNSKTKNNFYNLYPVSRSCGCECGLFASNIFCVNFIIPSDEKAMNCYLHQCEFARDFKYDISTTGTSYKMVDNITYATFQLKRRCASGKV